MHTKLTSVTNLSLATSARTDTAVRNWLETNRDLMRLWKNRARGRRRLLELDDGELADIGITRAAAIREAAKPFWKP